MELFRSYELRSVVAGNENYDWTVFENTATYKEGYTSTDLTVSAAHASSLDIKANYFALFPDSFVLGGVP